MWWVVSLIVFGDFQFLGVKSHAIPSEVIPSSDFQKSLHVGAALQYVYTPGIGTHKLYSQASTWKEARRICKEEKGHLAVINSVDESQAVANLLITAPRPRNGSSDSSQASIGIYDFYRDGNFTTIYDEFVAEAGFNEWFSNDTDNVDGDKHCGAIGEDGKFHKVKCNVTHEFVCEWPDNGTPAPEAVTERHPIIISEKNHYQSVTPGDGDTDSSVPTDLTTAPSFEDSESATVSGRDADSHTRVLSHPKVLNSSSENTTLGSGSGSALDKEGVEKYDKSIGYEHTMTDENYRNSNSKISQETKPDGYSWVPGDFSECSATCGGGIKSRLVRCLRRGDSEEADPELCDPEFEPQGTASCGEDPCPPEWEIGEWGPCNKNCGSGGEQTREIKCKQLISRNIVSTVDDSQCTEYIGPKAPEVQECNEEVDVSSTDNCTVSHDGYFPHGVGAALGPNDEGCYMACENSTFGCCDDGSTPAHGPNKEGCCLTSPHKCCPDNVRAALGPDFYGCGCQYARYRCCPDNTTTARGPNNEGCGCDHSSHGCCPDRITTASGPNFERCPCHTYQFGCCPDGISIARGPQNQGCGCENTEFKCCSDGVTPAKGGNYAGCTCDASKYGCCPDGVEEAQGENFEGCLRVPTTPGAACALEKDRGTCSNFSVRWFFDTEYGGCSRFWYGGCDGNENRFKSQEECKEVSVEPKGRDACFLPKIAGPCEGYNPTWYYDAERRQCGQFIYTGCLGNANRFKTREDCEELCVEPDDVDSCSPPREEGTCTEKQARWSFDQTENRCMPFYHTGCGGNRNNYETEEACNTDCPAKIDVCGVPKIFVGCGTGESSGERLFHYDSRSDLCIEFVFERCSGDETNYFGDKASCEERCRKLTDSPETVTTTTTTTTTIAPITQSPPAKRPLSSICLAPRDPGPCNKDETAYYYDAEKGSCQAFLYGGCEGNANRFRTIEQCERLCGSFQGQDVCNVPVDQGPCRAAFPKFHYDPITRTCQQFIWGGCEGSANRFSSEEECEAVCVHREEPPTGNTSNSAICKEPVDVGSCDPGKYWRYYYNDERLECLAFIYTGCGGNLNRFKSYDACRTTCLAPAMTEINVGPESTNPCELAPAECDAIHCEFGKEQYVDADDYTRCQCVNPCLDENCPEGTKCAVDRLSRGDVVEPQAVCRPTLKPGNCPKLWNSTTCQKECESDADCTGDFKCCSLGCGSSCLEPAPTEPITTPVPTYDRVPYPGAVPAHVETPEEPNIRAQEGGYVVMKCVASGNPRPVVTWRKGVTLINNSVSRYSVTVEGSLEIIDLYSTDAGTYTCTVDNHVAAPVRIQYELDITAPRPHDPVIIGERDRRVTVSLNSPATLECRAWGWPRPVITWWHESRILPVADLQYQYQRDHSLRINTVSLVDLGVYTCQAFNGMRKPASWSVTLQAPGPVYDVNLAHQQYLQYLIEPQRRPSLSEERPPVAPVLVKVNLSVEQGPFPAGSNFSIGCNVEGFPDPTVTWYKDDIPIQSDNRIRIHGVNRLVVTNAVKSDAGSYRCEAVNQYSRDDQSVEITVEGIDISPFCKDNPFFAYCALIIKGKYCQHDYYAKFCCRSCTEAGQLPV